MKSSSANTDQKDMVESRSTAKAVVLLVDDDVASLLMAEGPLLDAGYDVVQATDGLQAIEQFNKRTPDLIIMDAVMPNMDGFDAIAHIRQTEAGAHTPILMITGLEDLGSITKAYEAGATDFIVKPVNFFILPHRVQYMLRSKDTADELRESQARLDNAQRIAKLGHWEWHIDSKTANWSLEVARMLGLDERYLLGSMDTLFEKMDAEKRHGFQIDAEQAVEAGTPISFEFNVATLGNESERYLRFEAEPKIDVDGNCTHMLGTIQDVTESVNAQKQIHDLAYNDLITGLPNRAQLIENLSQALRLSDRQENQFALLFLDLDHFKQVNDTLGHDAGDELLLQFSQRLSDVLRDSDTVSAPLLSGKLAKNELVSDTVARIGGDEFVIILGEIHSTADAARVASRIITSVSEPYIITDVEVAVTTTIGISVYPEDGRDSDTLMKHADVAMYHAKENGRNAFQFYSRNIHEDALSRFSLERELKLAIEENQLTLHYLPKINVITGEVVGVEALARWSHHELGDVRPDQFIPIAEETGLILPLGKWVLNEATSQIKRWQDSGLGSFSVSVNVSPVQFTRGNMVSDIQSALEQNKIDPDLLEIELKENLFLNNIDNGIQMLNHLNGLGVRIAIDDFGKGVSSLSYLKRLPVDKLKIDRSFVNEMHCEKGDEAMVSSLITLAHNLDLMVVAEGVENKEQFNILHALKCDEVQGYYFSQPLSSAAFEQWVIEHDSGLKRAS